MRLLLGKVPVVRRIRMKLGFARIGERITARYPPIRLASGQARHEQQNPQQKREHKGVRFRDASRGLAVHFGARCAVGGGYVF